MEVPKYAQIAFVLVIVIVTIQFSVKYFNTEQNDSPEPQKMSQRMSVTSDRVLSITPSATLPIEDIVPNQKVKHSIPLAEIRQGCSRQDCIPSVDSPQFISLDIALTKIDNKQIGIALSYKGEHRFYPFSMLVTKEIVNDVVAGDALLITYCPLCGTGIVFDRTINGLVYEFGVSGMLWQSNLLMYNRSDNIADRNLWSQVLGEAVVGDDTGAQLTIIASDIMQFSTWAERHPKGSVLDTGSQRDPYSGAYYEVAQRFAPDFDAETSPLTPDTYVYGIEVDGAFKAYPRHLLHEGTIRDMINNDEIIITNNDGEVAFTTVAGVIINDVEGFWFSWVAAHPETLLWNR
ncbi:MAG: hypothetical protein ACI92I_000029 [Acidimicrobiales bacterium]|jgi:hypothetical protein